MLLPATRIAEWVQSAAAVRLAARIASSATTQPRRLASGADLRTRFAAEPEISTGQSDGSRAAAIRPAPVDVQATALRPARKALSNSGTVEAMAVRTPMPVTTILVAGN